MKKKSRFIDRTGQEFEDKYGSKFTIIEYKSYHDVTIKFEDGFVAKNVQYSQIKKKNVTNLYRKSLYGIGFLGEGKYKPTINRISTKEHRMWHNMFTRVYNLKSLEKRPTYLGCSVAEEWHNFQNFAEWCEENWKPYMEGWHLDKDILVKGNKIYSPETCCFVPHEINMLFTKRKTDYIMGINKTKSAFIVQMNIKGDKKYFGSYSTFKDATYVLKEVKEKYIKEMADEWKDKIDPRVYEAMYNYQVEIDD